MRKAILAFGLTLFGSLHAQTGLEQNLQQQAWVDSSTIPPTFHYTWWGESGKHYLVQVSEDLSVWSFLPNYNPAGANATLGVEFTYESPRIFVRAWQFDPERPSGLADTDADGVPDVWEQFYFGNLTTMSGDWTTDSNGDGISDWEAWLVGFNPSRPSSDWEAPVWSSGSTLTASNESSTGLTLSWPEAEDNASGIVKYVVYRNGEPQGAALTSQNQAISFSGYSGWQRWSVRPVDGAGNYGAPSGVVERNVGEILDVVLVARGKNRSLNLNKWGFPPLQAEPDILPVVRSFAKKVTTQKRIHSGSGYDGLSDDNEGRGQYFTTDVNIVKIHTEQRTPTASSSIYSGSYLFETDYPDSGWNRTHAGGWNTSTGAFTGTETITSSEGTETTNLTTPWLDFLEPNTILISNSTEYLAEYITEYIPEGLGATYQNTLSEPIDDQEHEEALISLLPDFESLSWGNGVGASRNWNTSRLLLGLGDSQYKVIVPSTIAGKSYRVSWLEVFYPEQIPDAPPPVPVAQTFRQVILEGTGEQVESEIFTLNPPSEEGTISLMPMGIWLGAANILALNNNYDERISNEEVTEPWVMDMDSPSPVRSDGTLALDDLIVLSPASKQYGQSHRFGPDTSGVRLSIVEGSTRARMIAIAPEGSGEDGAYTEADWDVLENGTELWGQYFGRKDSNNNALPDWTIYLEGLEPGKVVTSLSVDVLGKTLAAAAATYVVKVELIARDWKTGEVSEVAGDEVVSAPRPEVELNIDSAVVVDGNKVRIELSGVVRDPLSEIMEEAEQKVAGVVFYVDGKPLAGLGNLPARAGNPVGARPWQPRVFEAEFSKTLEIPVSSPKPIWIRAKTTPNAAGQAGWAEGIVVLGRLAADNPPPALVPMTLKWVASPTSLVIDQLRLSSGSSIPGSTVPLATETGADAKKFTGKIIVDGVERDAEININFEPDAGNLGESLDGLVIYENDLGVDIKVSGVWTRDSSDPLVYRISSMHAPEGVLAPLKVLDTINLGGTTEDSFAPIVARVDGLQDAEDDEALPALASDGSGRAQDIRPFTFSPEYHYIVKPSFRGAPALLIASSPKLYAPDQRVEVLKAGPNNYTLYAPGQPAIEGTSVYVYSGSPVSGLPEAPRSAAATLADVLFWYEFLFDHRPELPRVGTKSVPVFLHDVFTDANCAYEIVDGKEVKGSYLTNFPTRLLIQIGDELDPMTAAFGLLEAYESLIRAAPISSRLVDTPEILQQRNANVKAAIAPLRELGLAVMEAQFAFLNEGADVVMSIEEVAQGNMYAALGVIPGIPSSINKVIIGSAVGTAVVRYALEGDRLIRFKEYLSRLRIPLRQSKKGTGLLIDTIEGARGRCDYLKAEGLLLPRETLAEMYNVQKILSVDKDVSRRLLMENLDLAGKSNPSTLTKSFQAHHDLPLEFERQFILAGLDPNVADYGRWIPKKLHATWSNAPGYVSGGPFNDAWRRFFFDSATGAEIQRTRGEILEFMNDLRNGKFKYTHVD